jgi:hypothetical protein
MVVTEVGSVAVTVAMIATDERYGMISDTVVHFPSFWFSETHVMLLEACGASHLFITLGQTLLLTFVLLCVSLLARLQMNLEHAKLQLNARHHIKSPISLPPPCALLPF